MNRSRAIDVAEAITLDCVCGKTSGVLMRHWQKTQCCCGRWYYALRPKANGPLRLEPWPGSAPTVLLNPAEINDGYV